jgi:UDP-N-acetylglucosamine 4,6-dehydratase
MLKDADILITGGTGSFGQALVRHLLALESPPRRVVVFSRDELKQHDMARALGYKGEVDNERLRFFLGDVRDPQRLATAFRGVDYVIHAAAMKQVPACEYNPTEAVQTNIQGAMNVANAAIEAGVKRVIALSTDKAVSPVNLYGATKLAAEKLFTASNHLAGALDTRFACVRYGNVLGSRGSVLQVWRAQLAAGKKPTLTDPAMTRFWITLRQAVAFVLEHLHGMRGGEVFIPKLASCDMLTLLEALAPQASWEQIPVRQGEKYHETLIGADEARNAWEFQHHYEIVPNQVHLAARRLEAGWSYRSDTNRKRYSATELRLLIPELL